MSTNASYIDFFSSNQLLFSFGSKSKFNDANISLSQLQQYSIPCIKNQKIYKNSLDQMEARSKVSCHEGDQMNNSKQDEGTEMKSLESYRKLKEESKPQFKLEEHPLIDYSSAVVL